MKLKRMWFGTDCRIPSSSELLYSSAAAKVKNNQPAKDIALRSNEKHNQQQRELLTNQEVKRLKRTKDEKGKSCEKIIDYYQYMADSETEDELTQTTHIAFSPCSNGKLQEKTVCRALHPFSLVQFCLNEFTAVMGYPWSSVFSTCYD